MSNLSDIQAAVAAAAAVSADENVVSAGGGGDYQPPAEGFTRLRLVAYIETGKHASEYKGQEKIKNEVQLVFELSGPKHAPKDIDGVKYPHRITVRLNKSLSERATYYKLFKTLNWDGKAKIMAQLLGQEFIGRVYHSSFTGRNGDSVTTASFYNPDSGVLDIRPPFVEDPESGEPKRVKVDEPLSEIRFFSWDTPSLKQWASIFIEGEYEAKKDKDGKETAPAKSKNVFQERIKAANNFAGSPIAELLLGGDLDIAEDDAPPINAESEPGAAPAETQQAEKTVRATGKGGTRAKAKPKVESETPHTEPPESHVKTPDDDPLALLGD